MSKVAPVSKNKKPKVSNNTRRTFEEAKTGEHKTISVAAAIWVSKNGIRRVIYHVEEYGDGHGTAMVQEFVEEARPLLEGREELLCLVFKVGLLGLEQVSDSVTVLGPGETY
jgi:hypothetical protein